MDPKISYFKTFVTTSKTKSFSKAAKKLGITQGTVSNHISALEKYFDTQLFIRTPEGVELTPEGQILYESAKMILELIESTKQRIKSLHEYPEGTVKIAASTTPGEHILPGIIMDYKREYKDVDFHIEITDSKRCFELLEKGSVDMAAVGYLYNKDYEHLIIGKDRLVLIVPPNHRLAKKGIATLSDIMKEDYIDREEGSGTREVIIKALNEKGYSMMDLNVVMRLGSNSSIITAVSEGNGVSIISEIPAKKAAEAGLIKIVPIEDLDLTRYLYLVKGKKLKNPSAVRSFWEFLEG
ncbi:transcriptional regulator [Methanofervidicoccus sp. A16]|uniref:selenium metabolism-associated LysR family transcriptional regulator n=1 Tax=Methanofervidicoccus sp. A16 TaxID=2607662 RepID=UPI001189460E|nr:selenium metabolism-associated LysR family transcriptional regulator [Methanofervidicoccus sp. A16]AXI25579.1 transcriptional regulator [Methanofervidicoccus sp. A16]